MSTKHLFALPFLALLGGCVDGDFSFEGGHVGGPKVTGSGNLSGKDLSVTDFHGIEAGGIFELRCKVGSTPSLRIEGEDNIIPLVEAKVTDGTLHLRTTQGFSSKHALIAIITTPNLDHFGLSGAAKGNVTGIKADSFALSVSGAGQFDGAGAIKNLDLEASGGSSVKFSAGDLEKIRAEISGGSNITLLGSKCDAIDLEASGGSSADLKTIQAKTARVDANGAANVKVSVSDSLLGEVSGAASIHYSGSPTVMVQKSGAASVSKD